MNLLEQLLPCWDELVENSGKTAQGLNLVSAIYLPRLSLGSLTCPVGVIWWHRDGPWSPSPCFWLRWIPQDPDRSLKTHKGWTCCVLTEVTLNAAVILKEELWGGPNSPGEEGGGDFGGRGCLWLAGWADPGPSLWGRQQVGRRREATKPTGCPIHPRSHLLEWSTHSFLSHAGCDETEEAPPCLNYPIYLPWSAIFFPLGVFAAWGWGQDTLQTLPLQNMMGKQNKGLVLFYWKRADPGSHLAPQCLGSTLHICPPVWFWPQCTTVLDSDRPGFGASLCHVTSRANLGKALCLGEFQFLTSQMWVAIASPPQAAVRIEKSAGLAELQHAVLECSVNGAVVVQSLSRVRLFVTPWTAACQASLPFTISQSLLRVMSIEWVMPSNHLIFCCPLLFLPSVFPSIRVFSNQLALRIRWLQKTHKRCFEMGR